MTNVEAKKVASIDTRLSADSVEWHPNGAFENYLVLGTYHVEKKEGVEDEEEQTETERKGRVQLLHYDFEKKTLRKVFFLETNAVLDQKWFPNDGHLLTVADSKGYVTTYEMKDENLNQIEQFFIGAGDEDKEILALSLDWNKDGSQLAVSNSHGGFTVHQLRPEGFEQVQSAKEHKYEQWTVAFDKNQSNILYSGSDDKTLVCYDLRESPTPKVLWTKQPHEAGVTSLFSPPGHDNIIITGSYDEYIRVFDTRSFKKEKDQLFTNGGVWRIKQHPKYPELLLTANMYASAAIIKFDQGALSLKELARYPEHAGICYGCDWAPIESETLTFTCCSFYDKLLTVAEVEKGKLLN